MQTIKHDWYPRGLPPGFEFGKDCYIDTSYSCLHCDPEAQNPIKIGHHTEVLTGTYFDLGPKAHVEIGNFSAVGNCILRAESEITIGNYVMVSFDVVITDCERITPVSVNQPCFKRFPPANCPPQPVRIGDYVWIGFKVMILAGVTIGDGAIIGAGSVVSEDVPPMTVVAGNPARIVKRMGPIPEYLKR